MNVLSLFDGISGAQVALRNLGVTPSLYCASEINRKSIQITRNNFPFTVQLGTVEGLDASGFISYSRYDLVVFGSPCTDLSVAKKNRQSLQGKSSSLFYEAIKVLKVVKPRYFLMENVASMSEASKNEISELLGVEPVRINSNHFIPQNRDRLYWFNWKMPELPVPTPKRFEELLFDEQMVNDDASYFKYNISSKGLAYMTRTVKGGRDHFSFKHHSDTENKNSACIVSNFKKGVPYNVLIDRRVTKLHRLYLPWYRHFDPVECERLQGFPDDYTKGVANTHRFEAIGNAFTVPVIDHILRPTI